MSNAEPRLFLTKTWGWDPERYPTFGFSEEGARDNFLRQASHGDWIVIAGTRSDPTEPSERGKLLGMCQVGHEKVDADAVLRAIGTPLHERSLGPDGRYIWRWAMPIIKAVYFDPQPDLQAVLGSYLPGQVWALYARDVGKELGPEAVRQLLALSTKPALIAQIPLLEREAAYSQAMTLQKKYGASGPPPSTSRRGSEREEDAGFAYAFSLVGSKVPGAIKIGSSRNPQDRLKALNAQIRPHLTGCEWKFRTCQAFASETYAYRFEQMLLRQLRNKLIPGDREVVGMPFEDLLTAWVDLFFSKAWADETFVEEPATDPVEA